MLHTINKLSPTAPLEQCLALAADGDAVLLINDAVSAARPDSPWAEQIAALAQRCEVYLLQESGAPWEPLPGVTVIDMAGFVSLAEQHQHCQSWY